MWINFTPLNNLLRKLKSLGFYLTGLILDILFPKFCVNCQKEGSYLCQDCFSLIDISEKEYYFLKNLNRVFCPASYDNFIVKKLINQFKYQPYIKELAKPIASLIIAYLINLDKSQNFQDFTLHHFSENNPRQTKFTKNGEGFILIPIPLHKNKLKVRGFNQASEIAKELSKFLKAPLFEDVLIKTKQTPQQAGLKKEERENNVKGVFSCQKPEIVRGRKILLIDDVFTTGATLEEAANVLRAAGAPEVWAVVCAHG